jgi:ABC-type proline/glycine betaine transport system ATPase subunit
MSDKIKNYYENLPKDLRRENKVNNTFKNHHILPNSMICAIGGTGTGKTNSILDMIHRMDGTFYQIIVFNPVSTDEPIYNLLKKTDA